MLNFPYNPVSNIHISDLPSVAEADKGPDKRWEIVLSVVALALVALCVFFPWIFTGKAFYWGDIGLFFLPLNHFLKESLSDGHLPLWNPYLYCGAPFVGNPQVSLLYPSTLLLPIFPAVTAIMISETAHIFAAGMFFWLFARRGSLKLEFIPAILSAITYMLCGYFVAKAQFPNMLAALTYVPLLLYQTELLVQIPSVRRSVIFGVVLGLQLLAAHTQITVFTFYLIVPYGLLIFLTSTDRSRFFRILGMSVAGGIVAAGLASAYWLPVAELLRSSARQALTLKIANRFYLPMNEIGNFVLPHLHGSPMNGNWHAHGNYWETDNYVGLVPFLLAVGFVISTLQKDSQRKYLRVQVFFWLTVLVVSIWLSFGSLGLLYRVAFVVLPALKAFHDPARLMLGANIALALFAGAGLQFVLPFVAVNRRLMVSFVLIALSILDLGHHDMGLYPLKPVSQIEQMSSAAVPTLISRNVGDLGAGRVLEPDSQRTWQSFTTYKTFESSDPSFLKEWPDTLSPCMGMTYGLREVGGYDPEFRKDSQELVDLAEQSNKTQRGKLHVRYEPIPINFSQYLATLGTQYLVTYRINSLSAPGLTPVFRPSWSRRGRVVTVYRDLDYSGRAGLYSTWECVASQTAALSLTAKELKDKSNRAPFTTAIVEGSYPSSAIAKASVQPVQFTKDEPDDVRLTVRALP